MHIPPYHKKRTWQIFLIGLFSGSIIAYIILAMMYGKMYEAVIAEKIALTSSYNELKRQNEALLEDKEQLQEEAILTVQSLDIHYINTKEFRFDRLMIHQLNDLIKQELKDIVGKEVKSISANSDLLVTVIENKTFTIDELSYQFEVRKMTLSEQVAIDLYIKLAP